MNKLFAFLCANLVLIFLLAIYEPSPAKSLELSIPPVLSKEQNKRPANGSLLCRLGFDKVNRSVSTYVDYLPRLRAGWYFDFGTALSPARPLGIQYAQNVNVKQWKVDANNNLILYGANAPYAVPYTYTISPPLGTIQAIARANPGSLWLIGNEIERRDWLNSDGSSNGQNEILPELYAKVYHEVYTAIKVADPTARVANGSVIVPTPLRLQYLTRMWNEYVRLYGRPMPVDVWQTHVYLGPEKRNYWGIDIPAGIDADTGMFYWGPDDPRNVLVNKDFSYVPGLIRDFRRWLKDRGQQDKPLVLTEFGVSMPDWVMPGEFTPEKIRDEYMVPGLNFLLNEKDSGLGYPADEYRLVQSTWWWSLDYDSGRYDGPDFLQYFNGNLLWSGLNPPNNPHAIGLTTLGTYWVNYVSGIAEGVNLMPISVIADPPAFSSQGQPVTVTLQVRVSNSGNIVAPQPFSVVVETADGLPIGSYIVSNLEGCGTIKQEQVIWTNVTPGVHRIQVRVDSQNQVAETNENDNVLSTTILVASQRLFLPLIFRSQ